MGEPILVEFGASPNDDYVIYAKKPDGLWTEVGTLDVTMIAIVVGEGSVPDMKSPASFEATIWNAFVPPDKHPELKQVCRVGEPGDTTLVQRSFLAKNKLRDQIRDLLTEHWTEGPPEDPVLARTHKLSDLVDKALNTDSMAEHHALTSELQTLGFEANIPAPVKTPPMVAVVQNLATVHLRRLDWQYTEDGALNIAHCGPSQSNQKGKGAWRIDVRKRRLGMGLYNIDYRVCDRKGLSPWIDSVTQDKLPDTIRVRLHT